jgi:dihydrodipicolinate synthase/N-acetylneuraminate lyase
MFFSRFSSFFFFFSFLSLSFSSTLCREEFVTAFFRRIADQSKVPVVLYSIPK